MSVLGNVFKSSVQFVTEWLCQGTFLWNLVSYWITLITEGTNGKNGISGLARLANEQWTRFLESNVATSHICAYLQSKMNHWTIALGHGTQPSIWVLLPPSAHTDRTGLRQGWTLGLIDTVMAFNSRRTQIRRWSCGICGMEHLLNLQRLCEGMFG